MKKIISAIGSLSTTVLLMLLHVSDVAAQITQPLKSNPKYVQNTDVLTIQAIEGIVANILAIAISGIGFAGFVMMIVGAFQYMLSGGNSKGVEGGRNTLTFAIVGLVVALSSWIILQFIAFFTGVETIKTFDICFGDIGC